MIRIVSFGYKHRSAPQDYVVLDCRAIKNPHSMMQLRPLTGRDQAVKDYVAGPQFDRVVSEAMITALDNHPKVAFGCVGGRHRSVAAAEETGDRLREMGYEVEVIHSELG